MKEQWQNFYTREQLEKVQHHEIDLLNELSRICSQLDIKLIAYGGTLLGIIKYDGFIPWDDDIDIAMIRSDYEKFINKAESLISDQFILQTPENTNKSPFPYAKLRKKNTIYKDYATRNIDIESGIYIDIYPIDRIPNNEILRKLQFQITRFWILFYVIRQTPLYDKKKNSITGKIFNVFKFILCRSAKVIPQTICINIYKYFMTMYNSRKYNRYAALNSPNYNNIYVKLYPLIQVKFYNIPLYIPNSFESHLTYRYGDWRKELDPQDRIGHVPYELKI